MQAFRTIAQTIAHSDRAVDPAPAALEILRQSGKTMPVKEVVAAALADPQVTGLQGRTPAATLSAALYTEAKRPDGALVRVGRGMVKARPQPSASAPSS